MGKLLKGGEPDITITSRIVLNDWQRGKLPYYTAPPGFEVPKSRLNNEDADTTVGGSEKTSVESSEMKNSEVKSDHSTDANANGNEINVSEDKENSYL